MNAISKEGNSCLTTRPDETVGSLQLGHLTLLAHLVGWERENEQGYTRPDETSRSLVAALEVEPPMNG